MLTATELQVFGGVPRTWWFPGIARYRPYPQGLRPKLQKKIRSVTGCHLDLGDFAVPVIGAPGGMCHFLSDQQWVKHWLVYCGEGPENGTVVATDLPYGFETDGQFEETVPRSIDLAAAKDVTVC